MAPTLSRRQIIASVGHSAQVALRIAGHYVAALVDTGATKSVVLQSWLRRVPKVITIADPQSFQTAGGNKVSSPGRAALPVTLGPITLTHPFVIFPRSSHQVILGWDFLVAARITARPAEGIVEISGSRTRVPFLPEAMPPTVCAIEKAPKLQINGHLIQAERDALLRIIKPCYFATEDIPFGRARGVSHHIDTQTNRPINQGLRRTSPNERTMVQEEVAKMLACGAIRPSSSPWASPIVLVRKKDGSTRFCIDFRRVNDLTVKDVFPLPRISDMLAALSGATVFSSLDAASGYWQIPMEESSIPKTAFICSEGLYEWLVMPFGLCNAPATFQRVMQNVLAGLLWTECFVYIDDVLVFGRTLAEHNYRLERVLRRMAEHGLLLKASKCKFAERKVEFLGHVVSGDGVQPDPKKVDKLSSFPRPATPKQVRAFLGLGSYYRRFIKDFATLAAPLHRLTCHDVEWEWTDKCEQAFHHIKVGLHADAVQAHPDFLKPFLVDTDASEIGMACILSQCDDQGREKIVLVDSRKFSPAESRWHIREKEALGIVWALEKFRPFLLGTKFVVRTDHSSLEWLFKAKSGRLCRWAILLSEYAPFEIKHRSGTKHSNVDAFTRVFAVSETMPDRAFISAIAPFLPRTSELKEAQEKDKACQKLLGMGKSCVRDGVVGLGKRHRWRPVLPDSMLEDVTKAWHENALGGHLGARKLLSTMSRHFVVIGGTEKVKAAVKGCLACMQRKPPKQRLGLMASSPPSAPWHTVAMDFAGPYPPSRRGNAYVLVFVDQFTKWVEMVPTRDQTAITVVRAFYERILCRVGCPVRLLSDNGPQFKSALVETLCSYFGIRKIYSSAYYPQGDGYAERMMRTMNNSLAVLSRADPFDWDSHLAGLQFAYNTTEHEGTHASPFELNTGRIARLPGETPLRMDLADTEPLRYLKRLRNVIAEAQRKAREAVQGYWSRMKRQFDKHRRDVCLNVGDYVLVALTDLERRKFRVPKLAPRWSRPLKISKVLTNGVTYEVEKDTGGKVTVHVSRMLPLSAAVWGEPFCAPTVGDEKRKERVVVDSDDEEQDEDVYLVWTPASHQLQPLTETVGSAAFSASPAILPPSTGTATMTAFSAGPASTTLPPTVVADTGCSTPPPCPGETTKTAAFSAEPVVGPPPAETASSEAFSSGPTTYCARRVLSERRLRSDPERMLWVEWEGYPDPTDFTWEPRSHMVEDIPDLVRQFDNRPWAQRLRPRRRVQS